MDLTTFFAIGWMLASLAAIVLMWRKGHLTEHLGCALFASLLSSLLPVLLGGAIVLAALSLRNEREWRNAAAQAEKSLGSAEPQTCIEPSPDPHREAVKAA